MIKAQITNSFIDIAIDPVLTLNNVHKKGIIRYDINIDDNINRYSEAEPYNNLQFDIFGTDALVQLADALNIYIDNMDLRSKLTPEDEI